MIEVKEGVNFEDFKMVHPNLLILLGAITLYGHQNNLPIKITSILDDVEGRITRSHKEGRAFDLSVKGWSKLHIQRACYHMNAEYKNIAAISRSDGQPKACVYHKIENNVFHFHLQVKP